MFCHDNADSPEKNMTALWEHEKKNCSLKQNNGFS